MPLNELARPEPLAGFYPVMMCDDIIIGAGLTALAAAIGLPRDRKILVIGGAKDGKLEYYDEACNVPRGYGGFGGLGNYWHGVIPTTLDADFAPVEPADFVSLFGYFYPRSLLTPHLGQRSLFIPYFPIRTRREWNRASEAREGLLQIAHETALSFTSTGGRVQVSTAAETHVGQRLWIAAGALDSPGLIERSVTSSVRRSTVSDHVISYVGQIDRRVHRTIDAPIVRRGREGLWVPTVVNNDGSALFTQKPARFSYRTLDEGIEQRATFGLPTGTATAKLAKAASAGLIAEALFNKFGLFPDSPMLSVYAQIRVADAYVVDPDTLMLTPRLDAIHQSIQHVKDILPGESEITPSQRSDLFIKAIHLHHTVDLQQLEAHGINVLGSNIQVLDASVTEDIGCEHHSFKIMTGAFAKASRS